MMDLEKSCLEIYPMLEDYFIGAEITALALVKPKVNGLVVRRLLSKGLIERIEVRENLYVYKKTGSPENYDVLTEKIKALNAEQQRFRQAQRISSRV